MSKFIVALNSINTPWIALLVIVLGCAFDISSKRLGLNSDSASGIIGAGIGLLTGQVAVAASRATPTLPEPPEK